MNKFPLWKNILLIGVFFIAAFYALPNLFGENPAVQISSTTPGLELTQSDLSAVENTLQKTHIFYRSAIVFNKNLLIRFDDTEMQMQAESVLKQSLGDQYIVALNLERATPPWMMKLGAYPMKLGLDLRGGVHFLLQVDINSVTERREKSAVRDAGEELRHKKIHYNGIISSPLVGIKIKFPNLDERLDAKKLLMRQFPDFDWIDRTDSNLYELIGKFKLTALQSMNQYTLEQTMSTLRRRVNELGVSEAIVQQQGNNRIAVDLPGVQDAAEAKDILGKTATLEFHLVDQEHEMDEGIRGSLLFGSRIYDFDGRSILLKERVLLTGDSITNAIASYDESGRPSVSITLGGGGEALFKRTTAENVGKAMAVVYVEIKSEKLGDKIVFKKMSRVINVATIQSALGTHFQISGLSNPIESRNLSLLLRAGSLPAALTIIEEKTVGPSMGQRNIHLGVLSMEIGMILIVLFMAFYYHLFGIIADIGLCINLVCLVALLSLLGATLTFPGIAGIVLTIGMAVDYNVLIYERIREELRLGVTPQSAIHMGYERAFMTIIDANLTTLIVGLILFALGTGPVKGFAITLILGLLTSIVSSVTYTRLLTNWIYGGRTLKHLSIGIHVKEN